MANTSILTAFERMWQHVVVLFNKAIPVSLTQAEYDALGDEVNTNGVVYYITDGNSYGGGMEFKQVTTLPSDAASKANTMYIIV